MTELESKKNTMYPSDIIEVKNVLSLGLLFPKLDPKRKWNKARRTMKFHKHFGSSPLVLATQWYDMCHSDVEDAKMTKKEITRGFKFFLCAHFFFGIFQRTRKR